MVWRFQSSKPNLVTSQTADNKPIEVPATLPGETVDQRVKVLEETLVKIASQVNGLKSSSTPTQTTGSDSRLSNIEGSITELKARVSALEKATQMPVSSTSKSVIYIPLGSGGGPWSNTDWYSTPEYQITLDPANYPGYTGMVLEVTFRLVESAGTGSVRLYNASDGNVASSQVDTTSTAFDVKSTSSFTLSQGSKTYKLQVKSTSNKDLFIQSARIKVSF